MYIDSSITQGCQHFVFYRAVVGHVLRGAMDTPLAENVLRFGTRNPAHIANGLSRRKNYEVIFLIMPSSNGLPIHPCLLRGPSRLVDIADREARMTRLKRNASPPHPAFSYAARACYIRAGSLNP